MLGPAFIAFHIVTYIIGEIVKIKKAKRTHTL